MYHPFTPPHSSFVLAMSATSVESSVLAYDWSSDYPTCHTSLVANIGISCGHAQPPFYCALPLVLWPKVWWQKKSGEEWKGDTYKWWWFLEDIRLTYNPLPMAVTSVLCICLRDFIFNLCALFFAFNSPLYICFWTLTSADLISVACVTMIGIIFQTS